MLDPQDDLLAALVERVQQLEGRVGELNLLETPSGVAHGSGAANQVATWVDATTLQGSSRLTFGSLLNIGRLGTGAGNAEYWGVSIQNAASGDAIVLGHSSSTYTTGGVLGWVGNSQPFMYVPGTSFKIGFGSGTIPTVNIRSTGIDLFQPTIVEHLSGTSTAQVTSLALRHGSTAAAAAAFGNELIMQLHSSTNVFRHSFAIVSQWVVATDASRTARALFYTYDTAAREAFRIQGSGSAPMIGFLGAAAVARPAAYTQTYATATRTHANPTAADPGTYAAGANGYSTGALAQALFNSVEALVVDMANVKQVLNQVIDDLQAYGLSA